MVNEHLPWNKYDCAMQLKRIHLFEFEDFRWFPNELRMCLTRYIIAIHKLMNSADHLAKLCDRVLKQTNTNHIIDMCSGAGGPMEDVAEKLKTEYGHKDIKITLTDLYPNTQEAARINSKQLPEISYDLKPQNAAHLDADKRGLRTMVCSMHHMTPAIAKSILEDAVDAKQPICIYEISDNSMPPKPLWWIGMPFTFISVFFITFLVRPMTWQQLVFTYLIPLLPLFIAWDGTVSNIRTYTLNDWDQILATINSPNYTWEKDTIKGKGGNKMYLMGMPS